MMKKAALLPMVLLALGSSCVQPEKTKFAQTSTLAASIRFTQVTLAGSTLRFQLARDGATVGAPSRASSVAPVDFPEYVTYSKAADGKLTVIDSRIGVNATEAQCTDATCTGFQVKLSRVGSTASADSMILKSTRLPSVDCGVTLIDARGGQIDFGQTIKLANATATTEIQIARQPDGSLKYADVGTTALYGKSAFTDPTTGYLTNLYVRSFLGAPADLWIDEIDSYTQTDGRIVYVRTADRTYNVDKSDANARANTIDVFGSDTAGNRAVIGCTSSTPISAPPANPPTPTPIPNPSSTPRSPAFQ